MLTRNYKRHKTISNMFVNTIHIVGDKQDLVNIELNDQCDVNAHCDVANATQLPHNFARN